MEITRKRWTQQNVVMAYELRYTPIANMGLAKLERNEPKTFGKALRLLEEIQEHPRTGIGHPEQLSGDLTGKWNRRITKKYRPEGKQERLTARDCQTFFVLVFLCLR